MRKRRERASKGNYQSLVGTLQLAFDRASTGKGYERHAEDKPFEEQDIVSELEVFGIAPALFQIRKKAKETIRLKKQSAKNELLDIIVYAAAAHLYLERKED